MNDNITAEYITIENVIIVCDIFLDFMFCNRQVNFSFFDKVTIILKCDFHF